MFANIQQTQNMQLCTAQSVMSLSDETVLRCQLRKSYPCVKLTSQLSCADEYVLVL